MGKITAFYSIKHRRRREQKTDYRKRLALVKSGKVRAVIRKSLNNVSVQFVEYSQTGDVVKASANSVQLKKFNLNDGGNLPAAYLTGLLAGLSAKKAGVKEALADIGLHKSTKGSRLYAALKGILDAGISVPHDPKMLPDEKRIRGEHVAAHVARFKDLPLQFSKAKENITNSENVK